MNKILPLSFCIALMVSATASHAQSDSQRAAQPTTATQPPTVIDGALGPCSLQITVLTADGKPVAGADVKVHIAYGFGGFHKLDLEAGANSDGKVKFTGLPTRVRRPPLEFHASKDQLEGTLNYDPLVECQASHEMKLEKQTAP